MKGRLDGRCFPIQVRIFESRRWHLSAFGCWIICSWVAGSIRAGRQVGCSLSIASWLWVGKETELSSFRQLRPQHTEGMKRMPSTTPNQPTPGDFYMFEPDVESNRSVCGVQFTNKRQLLSPPRLILRPDEGGFPPLRELPLLTLEPSAGPEPRDLEAGFSGYWLISGRLHDVMAAVDPEAFAFAEVDYRLTDGTPGPRYYLCDVMRERDALDEAGSRLKIKIDDDYVRGKFYSLAGGASLAFRNEALKGLTSSGRPSTQPLSAIKCSRPQSSLPEFRKTPKPAAFLLSKHRISKIFKRCHLWKVAVVECPCS